LKDRRVEYQSRRDTQSVPVAVDEIGAFVRGRLETPAG
jgi:hypothetical protein